MDTPVSHTHTQDTRKCLFKSPVDAMQECDLPGYVTPLVFSNVFVTYGYGLDGNVKAQTYICTSW